MHLRDSAAELRRPMIRRTLVVFGSLLSMVFPCVAQTADTQDVIPSRAIALPGPAMPPMDLLEETQRMEEMQQWVRDYTEWRRWSDEWLNRTESGWLAARQRRARPSPPMWLFEECRTTSDAEGSFAEACRLLAESSDDPGAAALRRQAQATQARLEAPTKGRWWHHIHYDGFWPMAQSSRGAYGVFGVHATMDVIGDLQVFVTPGLMLMRVPNPTGGQEWHPAPVWGLSYKLLNFKVPGTQQPASLHANLVRAWVSVRVGNIRGTSTVNLAGFSISLK